MIILGAINILVKSIEIKVGTRTLWHRMSQVEENKGGDFVIKYGEKFLRLSSFEVYSKYNHMCVRLDIR